MRPRWSARSVPRPRTRILAILTGLSTLAVLPLPVGAEALEFQFLVRANLGPRQVQANDNIIDRPAISADGRYVAFASAADNLVAGDTAGWIDIFVRDQLTRTTTRVSAAGSGAEADGASFAPAISADGRFVAYDSYATNLTPDDTNGRADVFLYASAGAPALSADGTHLAFEAASRLSPRDHDRSIDVYVRDLTAGTSTLVSGAEVLDRPGAQRGISYGPSISADGRYVAFTSFRRRPRTRGPQQVPGGLPSRPADRRHQPCRRQPGGTPGLCRQLRHGAEP